MMRSPRTLALRTLALRTLAPRTLALRLALLGGICLLLIACGSGEPTAGTIAQNGAAQADVAQPTAVPTTAPLSLPPADASLPALASLPAQLPTSQADAATPVTGAAAESATIQPEAAPTTPTTATGTTTDTAPTSTSVDSQPPASAPSTPATGILAITSADRWSDCVLDAAQASDATALLDPIAAGTTTDMTSVQLNTLAAASVGCDMVTSALESTAIGDYLATSSSCLNAWLESSGGGSVLVGLTSIGWNQPTPAWAQPHLIDALDSCFTGTSFAADVMAVVSVDPSLTGAFDGGCLATSFDMSGTMRTFAQALASDPVTADLHVGLDDAWVLACANVGQMVAVAAAADGVTLSASTISCIDSELKASGAVRGLVTGTADTDAVGIATIACMTNAEATALLG